MENIVISAWNEVFKNSRIVSKTFLGSTCIRGYLSASNDECVNKISDNDHLRYAGWIEGDKFVERDAPNLLVAPTQRNMVYGSVKMRRASTKIDRAALVKRFTKVREFILENYNLENSLMDISTK